MSNQTFFHGGAGDPNRPVKGNTTFLNGGVEDYFIRFLERRDQHGC